MQDREIVIEREIDASVQQSIEKDIDEYVEKTFQESSKTDEKSISFLKSLLQ